MKGGNNWKSMISDLVNKELINTHSKSSFTSFNGIEESILEFRNNIQDVVDAAGKFLRLNAKEREFNRSVVPKFGAKIISLGYDCLPRTVLTRWGVKPSRVDGELTYPFDLAVHPTGVVGNLLNSNFSGYLEGENIEVVNGVPRNVKLNVNFNHETGMKFIENEYSLLKEKYMNRISNFNKLSAVGRCVFVHHLNNEAMLENLIGAVRRFRVNECHDLLVVIKTDSDFKLIDSLESQYGDLKVVCKYIPKPHDNYIWHEEAHYSSIEGVDFERKIVKFATESMSKIYSTTIEEHNGSLISKRDYK